MPRHRTTLRQSPRAALLLGTLIIATVSSASPAQVRSEVNAASAFRGTQIGSESGAAWDAVLGDVDGDGDLDLVVGGDSLPKQLYLNNGTGTPWAGARAVALQGTGDDTSALALGDVDGDGDLDLVAGTYNRPNQLYLNNGTSNPWLGVAPTELVAPHDNSAALALGDVDTDGDLDLVVGNQAQPDRLYLNNGTIAPWQGVAPIDISGVLDNTFALALGDVDGDGDLDLVVGNYGRSRLYVNNGTGNPWQGTKPLEIASSGVTTEALALGDVDTDGDLDLVIGDRSGPSQLYMNNGTGDPWRNVAGIALPAATGQAVAVALGDVDTDGDLDLITGGGSRPNSLHLNNGTAQPWQGASAINLAAASEGTAALALGDVDADGDLDFVAGNTDQPSRLYLNDIQVHPWRGARAVELSSADNDTTAVALGDVDGDGDLDLVTGSRAQPERLHLNTGTATPWGSGSPVDLSPPGDDTEALALGDVDSDGDLDLVVGNYNWPDRLYLNNGTPSPWQGVDPVDLSTSPDNTQALALGDVDRDGDLDLVVGNFGQPTRLYRNNGTANPWRGERPIDISTARDRTEAIVLGDVNGDGDLDLVVGNFGQPSRLYLNNGTADPWRSVTPFELPAPGARTQALALGDLDGDSDLDLVVGNLGQPTQMYLNNGTSSPWQDVAPISLPAAESSVIALAIVDLNGDGDRDLVVGAHGTPSQLYLNPGAAGSWEGVSALALPGTGEQLQSLGLGDVDADGDLDLVAGNSAQPDRLYLSTLTERRAHLVGGPRAVMGAVLPRLPVNGTAVVTVPYTLVDPQRRPAREVRGFYSLDGGTRWLPAPASTGTNTQALASSPDGVSHTFSWDLAGSEVNGYADNVRFRLVVSPDVRPARGDTAGSFRFPGTTTTTGPFAVRGTQAMVRLDGAPASGALVYRLAPEQIREAEPIPARRAGHPQLATDHLGFLQGQTALAAGDSLIAMVPISHTDTYSLYLMSASPTPLGLDANVVSGGGIQVLEASRENPLILFNLDVALEWDARGDPVFLQQLEADLTRASELLFRWSSGQAALGDITVYDNRAHWDDAHIRIYATNRMRPNAVKGGIVREGTEYPDPNHPDVRYTAGQIRMGAIWNRYGEATANMGDDWARTLAHELGHFALFLDDNYLGFDDGGRLVSVASCRGPMTDPYRDDYGAFHPDAGWQTSCGRTLSHILTGRSDWATIKAFYESAAHGFHLTMPDAFAPERNPGLLPLAVTRVAFALSRSGQPAPISAPVVVLTAETGELLLPGAGARGVLFQDDRLIDLGRPTHDQLLARGARPGDRVCVYELDQGRLGCRTISTGYQQLPLLRQQDWRPDVQVTPITSTTLQLDVDGLAPGLPLRAQLYPASGARGEVVALGRVGTRYQASLSSPAGGPAFEGFVHLWVDEAGPGGVRREAIVDFLLGGNPGGMWGRRAPRGNPGGMWGRRAPVLSPDGQAILFSPSTTLTEGQFFVLQVATSPPAPLSWAVQVGRAYRITATPGLSLSGSSINISYLGDEVPRGQESGIQIYFYDTELGRWTGLETRLDTQRNEASALALRPGVYTLMTSVQLPLASSGWNLVYFYPGGTQPARLALAGAEGRYTTIYGYDAHDHADPWKLYDIEVPAWVSDLEEVAHGQSYWVNATRPITVPVLGGASLQTSASPAQSTVLSAPPATYYGVLNATAATRPAVGTPVVATIGGVRCGEAVTRLVEGRVVFALDVRAAGGGASAGCGTPGRTVLLTVGEHRFTTWWSNQRPRALTPGIPGPRGAHVYLPLLR